MVVCVGLVLKREAVSLCCHVHVLLTRGLPDNKREDGWKV